MKEVYKQILPYLIKDALNDKDWKRLLTRRWTHTPTSNDTFGAVLIHCFRVDMCVYSFLVTSLFKRCVARFKLRMTFEFVIQQLVS